MYILVIIFLISFILTWYLMPFSINSLKEKDIVVVDKYKLNQPKIPTQGALIVIFCTFFTVSISTLISKLLNRITADESLVIDQSDISMMLVISLFALYGVFDDLVDIGWGPKVLLPVTFSFPLMVVFEPSVINFPLGYDIFISSMSLGILEELNFFSDDLFKLLIIPIYIMVVSNLVNMHSGFNGLQSGLSCLLLSSIIIFSLLNQSSKNLIPAVALLGSMIVLWSYNKFPAQIFEGNIGSMTFGATIGCVLVIKEYYIFGIIILIPHIIDFIFWFYESRILKKRFKKFGYINNDGTINSPTPMKLKFTLPFYYSMKEKEVVNSLYLLTLIFCLIGIFIFRL